MGLVVIVQTVATQSAQQRGILGLRLGNIADVDTGGVALYLDVEAELLLLDVRCQIVDVLHHQVPVGLLRIVAGVLQGLHVEGFTGIGMVGGKLAHTVGDTAVGILVGHGQHLVGL